MPEGDPRLRNIPPVNDILKLPDIQDLTHKYPRSLVILGITNVLNKYRNRIRSTSADNTHEDQANVGATAFQAPFQSVLDQTRICNDVAEEISRLTSCNLRKVINAAGVVIHTNLGRVPLPTSALEALQNAAQNYSNLEYDLSTGERGSRYHHVQWILQHLTGAEDSLVVNNNAAAVLLLLSTFARGKEVVISRGELVEIGGSFRIPEIMSLSGAVLKEVGTTNRTRLSDFSDSITDETAVILKVHTSNFRIIGFTSSPDPSEVSALARQNGLIYAEDLGSGTLIDLSNYGIPRERTVSDALASGADVVTFSGDKLLGGPQAGIIVGADALISKMKANHLTRALRIDKLTVASLEATLRLYLDKVRALTEIPALRYLTQPLDTLENISNQLQSILEPLCPPLSIKVVDGTSQPGGGSLPGYEIPTKLVAVKAPGIDTQAFAAVVRKAPIPVITRISRDAMLLDVRTIEMEDFTAVRQSLEFAVHTFFSGRS